MQQKYVLPDSTWSFLPFSDETARAAQSLEQLFQLGYALVIECASSHSHSDTYPKKIPVKLSASEKEDLFCSYFLVIEV